MKDLEDFEEHKITIKNFEGFMDIQGSYEAHEKWMALNPNYEFSMGDTMSKKQLIKLLRLTDNELFDFFNVEINKRGGFTVKFYKI